MNEPSKTCAACGRTITWRKKWARDWDEVRYCSDGCRRHGRGPLDEQLEKRLLAMLDERSASATVCPSEVARAAVGAGGSEDPGDLAWRELMEPVRRAARRLTAAGSVEITQQGRVVDPSTAKGPIRIRRRRPGTSATPEGPR